MIFFACFIGALFAIWTFLRYSNWLISRFLSLCSGSDVNVGGFCRWGVVDVRIRLASGISLNIDSLNVVIFPQEFNKPLAIRLGDVRVESDTHFLRNRAKTERVGEEKNRTSSGTGRTRTVVTVVAQYMAGFVSRVHVVLMETLPGYMIHVTVDDLAIEGFRSREGWQLEIGCRLAQGKALRRKSVPQPPIAEFGLQFGVSIDLSGSSLLLKKFAINIKDPMFCVSHGIFELFSERNENNFEDFYEVDFSNHEMDGEKDTVEPSRADPKLSQLLTNLTDLSFSVNNCTLRYIAPVHDGSRTLSVCVRSVELQRTMKKTDAKMIGLSVSDQAGRSVLKSALLQLNAQETPNQLDAKMSSDCVHTTLRISDVLWWRQHFIAILPVNIVTSPLSPPVGADGPSFPTQSTSFPPLSLSFEIESLTCDVMDMDSQHSRLSVNLFTFSKTGKDMEFGVDSLLISSLTSPSEQILRPESPTPEGSFDVHHWGQMLHVGVALVQVSSSCGRVSILVGIDDAKLEWSDRLAMQIQRILESLGPAAPQSSPSRRKIITTKARLKRFALLASARDSSFVVYSADEVAFESSDLPADLAISLRNSRCGLGEKLVNPFCMDVLYKEGKFVPRKDDASFERSRCWNQSENDRRKEERRMRAEEVYKKRGIILWGLLDTLSISVADSPSSNLRDILLSCHGEVYLNWSPLLHRTAIHIWQIIKKCLRRPVDPECPSVAHKNGRPSICLKILTNYPVVLDLSLPRHHRMAWRVPSLHIEMNPDAHVISSPELTVTCNGQRILHATAVSISKKPQDLYMDTMRKAFGDLENLTNKVWVWSADTFVFSVPFEFNFAEVFSEFVNAFKWIKIVHNIPKKEFTSESPLPADVLIIFKEARLEMEDDPFESHLQCNYELMEDEVYECERRRQMLIDKLEKLKKSVPLLAQAKIDEMFDKLQEKNSTIYVERWKKQPPQKSPLFVSTWKDFKIRAFADHSLHGTRKCVDLIHEFDPVSHYPCDGITFTTLWARACELDTGTWTAQFRDYPQPYMMAEDMHFFGTLVGAEELEESGRSLRECQIPLPEPWETHTVLRNMAPLKYYYDMQCECAKLHSWYGPCWEPCLSMVSVAWNNISAPSIDPSDPLPFWDKMRYLLHGRFLMLGQDVRTTMLSSPDPYNSTETVEWCWNEFGLDWQIGEIRIRSGLSIFMRTASKYDDSRIIYLPELRWRIALDWVCMGDPHDHHAATPCAPHRLPHCATGQEHDSFRAFRSQCLDLSFDFDVADVHSDGVRSDSSGSKSPHVLLYANTFRCIEFLFNTLTMTNRPVKKGQVFGSPTRHKPQLSKHFRDVRISVNFPYFYITYWMSHSSDYGFRVSSDGLRLSAFLRLSVAPGIDDTVRRRRVYSWNPQQVTAELGKTQVHVFGKDRSPTADGSESEETLLLGLDQLQYIREQTSTKDTALHRLIVTDLKASWTDSNRDACLFIADGVHRAHQLRSILSNDAIKILKLKTEDEPKRAGGSSVISREASAEVDGSRQPNSMLEQLIGEASTKLVAHCEQATELPTDSLVGVSQCTADDVAMLNWQIDLLSSQLVLKGCEKDGFLLVSAARASLTQKIHRCVWRNSQLLLKKSWSAVLSGMQYFAPVSSMEGLNKEHFRWLSKEVVEEKGHDSASDTLRNFISTGEAVGGVVQADRPSTADEQQVPLQRIVSRCSCQIYFCYYSENLKTTALEETGLPPMDAETDPLADDSKVDCLTLKHNVLESSSNSEQYEMVVDIVNNLVLFVDPKKKEVAEHRRRLRFECQFLDMQQMRESIMEQQTELREIVSIIRSLERQIYYLDVQPESERDEDKRKELVSEMEDMKAEQLEVSDQLSIFISCYKQRQVEQLRAAAVSARIEADQQAPVARRFEVCFEDCIWKLTDSDGQIGVAQLQIRNFLYTRVMRIDNSGGHCFEVGSIRVTNLLPDTNYRDTLHRDERITHLQPAIRVILRDMPPVAGICVKEHFEVNIAPMVAQITYRFFDKMMTFFFPGQNIHKDENLDTNTTDEGSQKMSLTRRLANIRPSKGVSVQNERKQSTISGRGQRDNPNRNSDVLDDIDRMRERADNNNLFVYIKIPEVPFVVSYKGKKEKNLLDVDRFNFVFPLCEYHERNWTWLDVSLAVKQRCRRVLLQQFMKQKLLRNRLVGGTDIFEGVTEEEKKKIALGTSSAIEKKKKK